VDGGKILNLIVRVRDATVRNSGDAATGMDDKADKEDKVECMAVNLTLEGVVRPVEGRGSKPQRVTRRQALLSAFCFLKQRQLRSCMRSAGDYWNCWQSLQILDTRTLYCLDKATPACIILR
jgi:hypothetical protein